MSPNVFEFPIIVITTIIVVFNGAFVIPLIWVSTEILLSRPIFIRAYTGCGRTADSG